MKKLFRAIVIVLVLLVITAVALPFIVPAEKFRAPVIAKIEETTGRKLTIDGDIKLTFFPNLSVHIEKATLGNPKGFSDTKPLIKLDAATIDVGTLSLLRGTPQINQLSLENAHITLLVNQEGVENWEFSKSNATEATSEKGAPKNPQTSVTPIARDLVVSDFNLKNSTISYADQRTGKEWTIGKLNASVTLDGLDAPFSVKGEGEWNKQLIKVNGDFSTLKSFFNQKKASFTADVKSTLGAFNLKGFIAGSTIKGAANVEIGSLKNFLTWVNPEVAAPEFPQALSIKSDVECSSTDCAFSKSALSFGSLQATGSLKATFNKEIPRVELMLETDKVNLNDFFPATQKQAEGFSFIAPAMAQISGHWDTAPFDLSGLRKLNALVSIKTNSVLFRNFKIGKTK